MGAEDLQGWKRLKGRGGNVIHHGQPEILDPQPQDGCGGGVVVVVMVGGGRRLRPSEGQMVNDATGHFLLLSSLRLADMSPLSSPPCP